MRYLWVGAFCIIQDDPSDLTSQLRVMADNYSGRYITILAATAEASTEGFLEDRMRGKEMRSLYKLRLIDTDGSPGFVYLEPYAQNLEYFEQNTPGGCKNTS